MIFESAIDNCFRSPTELPLPGSAQPILYLLRRDLQQLYGPESYPFERGIDEPYVRVVSSPLLASLGIVTGLDFMTHFCVKKWNPGESDFVSFLTNYGGVPEGDAKVVYKFRCALTHRYGLLAVDRSGIPNTEFELDNEGGLLLFSPIFSPNTNRYSVGLFGLKKLFLDCVKNLEKQLRNPEKNHSLLNNFHKKMEKSGERSDDKEHSDVKAGCSRSQ